MDGFELACSICEHRLTVDELTPAQAEHLIDAWTRSHAHNEAERAAYRAYISDLGAD